jgi:hypothetical protein
VFNSQSEQWVTTIITLAAITTSDIIATMASDITAMVLGLAQILV